MLFRSVYRGGAKLHDLICITGNLGAAYMGCLLYTSESERLLFVAHGIGCQSRFTQVHRGRQVVVRNLGCLLEQFDRCGTPGKHKFSYSLEELTSKAETKVMPPTFVQILLSSTI